MCTTILKIMCCLFLSCQLSHCDPLNIKCVEYEQTQKENIRNCLSDTNSTNVSSPVSSNQVQVNKISNSDKLDASVSLKRHSEGVQDGHQLTVSNLLEENKSKSSESEFRDSLYNFLNILEATKVQRVAKNTLEMSFKRTKKSTGLSSVQRKLFPNRFGNMLPYLIVPGLFMAGVLPWVLPGLNMVVMVVTMINQMAFSSSLFTLVRSFIFGTRQDEHVVYLNHGYKKKTPYGYPEVPSNIYEEYTKIYALPSKDHPPWYSPQYYDPHTSGNSVFNH